MRGIDHGSLDEGRWLHSVPGRHATRRDPNELPGLVPDCPSAVAHFVEGEAAEAAHTARSGHPDEGLCSDPKQLAKLLKDLLHVLQIQAKEIQRLDTQAGQTNHVPASHEMSVVVSELSELLARFGHSHGDCRCAAQAAG